MSTSSLRLPRAAELRARSRSGALTALRARPEVLVVVALAAVLDFWDLSRNGWANTFYAGAVKSMAASWHDFLFGSLDRSGLMTVDKPPAAFWVQALSVRIFGMHSLSILIPEALMGVVAAVLAYDLTRRMFGRAAGFAAAVTLVLTPITVAMSRHNNPDELLILSCVAAMWFAVRGLQDGRLRWLIWSGVFIGLGFETKMAVALFVVPGIFLAWLWMAPAGRGRLHALRQTLVGGAALAVVGLAWPVLVTLTPAADRPWISGTSDNSIWSLIVGYNGVGRVDGQAGGTGGASGGFGGGPVGVLRLLDSGLGGQAGWLLGFAVVALVGGLALTRLRRTDPRTGWLIAVGGAAVVSGFVFSVASGIFHPYYVSFLAPWAALLVGAGVGMALHGGVPGRALGALAIAGGVVSELIVLGNVSDAPTWATPLVIVVGGIAVIAIGALPSLRVRAVAVAVAMAALLAAPGAWAFDTLGHATSSTFPAGGPSGAASGGPGGFGGRGFTGRFGGARSGLGGSPSGFGGSGFGGSGFGGARSGFGSGRSGASAGGGMFGGDSTQLTAASKYAASHGGGTVAVESQSSAASAILNGETNVAGIGGFSGRESTVSAKWIAMEVRDGHLRWLVNTTSGFGGGTGAGAGRLRAFGGGSGGSFGAPGSSTGSGSGSGGAPSFGGGNSSSGGAPSFGGGSSGAPSFGGSGRSGRGGFGAGGPGADGRDGSAKAIAIAEKVARKVTFTYDGTRVTMYDLRGKAAAILAAAASSSSSASSTTT